MTILKRIDYLMPRMLEKWHMDKHYGLVLWSNANIEVMYNRKNLLLPANHLMIMAGFQGCMSIVHKDKEIAMIKGLMVSLKKNPSLHAIATQITLGENDKLQPILPLLDDSKVFHSNKYLYDIRKFIYESLSKMEKQTACNNQVDARLIKIHRYIRAHFQTPTTLRDLAELIGVHPAYLCNSYSRVFNISPIQHINILRIRKAKELLLKSNLSIKEIAALTGFGSAAQFSSIFKRFHFLTPSEYRLAGD
ncbi:helix-turn-helix transcriptional regulator [Paenibacillus athensensis]|uniref:HTH araC/xylS-type domain-containing protein n=1 Tax=Paenibacillus athensensis TaxID=1967502 RepID=A0A4Y8Q934_9BACL|nr:AraC family transcriptional regulator [Paenibacillus athensensis]MCD1258896.1 helix-turn-helix transcriptional regulator [Paenibacillus athensensis]